MTIPRQSIEGSSKTATFQFEDAIQTAVFLAIWFPAIALPPRHWPALIGTVARLSVSLRRDRSRELMDKTRRFFPGGIPGGLSTQELLTRIISRYIEERMIYIRLAWRPKWRPDITVGGLEHLDAALAKGGVVLWSVNQTTSVLLSRVLLNDAGYRIHHVRSWAHGPSSTSYGRKVLNTLHWIVENRCAEHIIVARESPFRALREITNVLRDGGIVSFRGVDNSDAPVTLPLFHGYMKIALGAPRTAFRNNASLIAVRCCSGDFGSWHLTFTPLDRRGAHNIESVAEEFRQTCEQAISDSPDLWPVQFRQFLI